MALARLSHTLGAEKRQKQTYIILVFNELLPLNFHRQIWYELSEGWIYLSLIDN